MDSPDTECPLTAGFCFRTASAHKMSSWHGKLSRFTAIGFLFPELKPKCERFSQKCGNHGKMRHFPHDCGTIDTYAMNILVSETKPQSFATSSFTLAQVFFQSFHNFTKNVPIFYRCFPSSAVFPRTGVFRCSTYPLDLTPR